MLYFNGQKKTISNFNIKKTAGITGDEYIRALLKIKLTIIMIIIISNYWMRLSMIS